MNIIFALRGRGSSGKTTTIRLLHELLIQNNYQILSTTFNSQGGDFRTVFIKNDKKIGITSVGDTFDLVHDNLRSLIDDSCTICVCACRTYDRSGQGTNAAIDSFTNFQKQYINKTIATSVAQEQVANQNDAQILFKRIDALVK
jgi:hypothetical protein